ncbi:MAG: TetR/AcrR family transcriptional regulator [Burkholderiales bacterium]|nr:TetR/AcrR family transcriptional regulator [Burkholderiales bacterium]
MMKQKIIATATDLTQKYGLNAFSYQDISKIVGITKASIHHHFPNKIDLSRAILDVYITNFFAQITIFEQTIHEPLELINKYINIFKDVAIQNDKLCLCLMYASEYLSLDNVTQELIKKFYLDNELWLGKILSTYLNQPEVDTQHSSKIMFATLQGLLIRHRIINSLDDFDNLVKTIFVSLQVPLKLYKKW